MDFKLSKEITDRIESGDLSLKPGWIRLFLHPTMTDDELHFILDAIKHTVKNAEKWKKDYCYDKHTNEFHHCKFPEKKDADFSQWFTLNR